MSIYSEKKGVIIWLNDKVKDENFSIFICNLYCKEFNVKFINRSFQASPYSKFHKFVNWFLSQDINVLKEKYKNHKIKKKEDKEIALDNYYKSDLHQFFIENKNESLNILYKQFKNKIRYGEFRAFYKKSKLKFYENIF